MSYATCDACQQEMNGSVCSQSEWFRLDGTPLSRRPYEVDDGLLFRCHCGRAVDGTGACPSCGNTTKEPRGCHDCGTPIGGFHHPGCDMETCPLCGGQAISCDCLTFEKPVESAEELAIYLAGRYSSEWESEVKLWVSSRPSDAQRLAALVEGMRGLRNDLRARAHLLHEEKSQFVRPCDEDVYASYSSSANRMSEFADRLDALLREHGFGATEDQSKGGA